MPGGVGVPIVGNRVLPAAAAAASQDVLPACGSCHRGLAVSPGWAVQGKGCFPTALRKRGAPTLPNIMHPALARLLHLYPVSPAGAWSSLPFCAVVVDDSQSPSQAGAALAWGMLLLAFLCLSSGV